MRDHCLLFIYGRFQSPDASRAAYDHTPARTLCRVDLTRGFSGDLIFLFEHLMLFDRIHRDRLKSPVTHVKRHIRDLDVHPGKFLKKRLIKMQSCRRRRHGPFFFRENGLIGLIIRRLVRPVDVRRKRDMAEHTQFLFDPDPLE